MIQKLLETKEVRKRCQLIAEYLSEDRHIAEDIMQTAFVEIWTRSAEYDQKIKTDLDFFKIFRKHAYNALRRVNTELDRYTEIPADMSTEDLESVDLSSYISRLPDRLRGILEMFAQGATEFEISEVYEISRGYVNKLKRRGVNAIKSMIAVEQTN